MLRRDHRLAQSRDRFRLIDRELSGSREVRNDRAVDVVASEVRISVGREDLENTLVQLENRDVERPAAEIVNRDLCSAAQLIQSVGESRGGGLVHDALDRKTRELAGAFRGAALRVIEVRGHGDHGTRNRTAECAFGVRL